MRRSTGIKIFTKSKCLRAKIIYRSKYWIKTCTWLQKTTMIAKNARGEKQATSSPPPICYEPDYLWNNNFLHAWLSLKSQFDALNSLINFSGSLVVIVNPDKNMSLTLYFHRLLTMCSISRKIFLICLISILQFMRSFRADIFNSSRIINWWQTFFFPNHNGNS